MTQEEQKIQELLKPRYKVLIDFPGSPFNIGNILYRQDDDETLFQSKSAVRTISPNVRHPQLYPDVFRRLEWWELREATEYPEYVRFEKENSYSRCGKVIKMNELKVSKGGFGIVYHDDGTWWATDCLPATSAEYQAYIEKQPTTHNQEP